MASRDILAEIYGFAARRGRTFDYPTKRAIAWAVDADDMDAFAEILIREVPSDAILRRGLIDRFQPLDRAETRRLLLAEARKPTKLRKTLDRDVLLDVYESSAGPLVWSLWPTGPSTHSTSSRTAITPTTFWRPSCINQPELFDRSRALVIGFTGRTDEPYEAFGNASAHGSVVSTKP